MNVDEKMYLCRDEHYPPSLSVVGKSKRQISANN